MISEQYRNFLPIILMVSSEGASADLILFVKKKVGKSIAKHCRVLLRTSHNADFPLPPSPVIIRNMGSLARSDKTCVRQYRRTLKSSSPATSVLRYFSASLISIDGSYS
ncbi:hypothetical protein GVAV_001151 [Gurleya vavrai]